MSASAGSVTGPGTGSDPGAVTGVSGPGRRFVPAPSRRDVVLSVLVVVALAAVIFAVAPRPTSVPRASADAAAVASAAAGRLAFTPVVPAGLPPGWTVTDAGVRNSADGITTWHIGYQTADGHWASIEQAARVTPRWEEIMDSGGTPLAPQTIDGTGWEQRYKDVRDVVALIHRGEGDTIMITSKGGGLANATVLARGIPASAR